MINSIPKGTGILSLVLSAILTCLTSAQAYEVTGTATVTSDYFWRGYSKSNGHVSGALNLDFSDVTDESGFYFGGWLSSTDFGDNEQDSGAELELLLYGGWNQKLDDDFYLDLQFSHYVFDDKIFGEKANYSEAYAFLHYRDILTFEVAYAPDAYALGNATTNTQINFRYPLHTFFDFSTGVGYFWAQDVFDYDYAYWNAGLTWKANRFSLDVRYFDSRETNEISYDSADLPYFSSAQWELPFRSSMTVFTLSTVF